MAKKKAVKRRNRLPRILLLVACDAVSRDPSTGKTSLYGIFDKYNVAGWPCRVTFSVYVKLAGGSGKQKVACDVVDSQGKSCAFAAVNLNVDFSGSLSEIAFVGFTADLPREGAYDVRLKVGSEFLKEKYRITAVLSKPSEAVQEKASR